MSVCLLAGLQLGGTISSTQTILTVLLLVFPFKRGNWKIPIPYASHHDMIMMTSSFCQFVWFNPTLYLPSLLPQPAYFCFVCQHIRAGVRKKHGQIVPFWQNPLGPPPFFREKKFTHHFLGKMNHWCVKQILHLVPSKNLYICFCYICLHLPKIGQNLISGHSDQYIALH